MLESAVSAPAAGVVRRGAVHSGANVEPSDLLVVVEPERLVTVRVSRPR